MTIVSGTFFTIIKNNKNELTAMYNGVDYNKQIPKKIIEEAYNQGKGILFKDEEFLIREFDLNNIYDKNFYNNCYGLKPNNLFISELNWKTTLRNIIKAKNMLFVGFTGTAKTKTSMEAAKALKRPFFKIPMNSTEDAKLSLIGGKDYTPERGTYFQEAELLKAIQIENAVILLDEITRASKNANNIIMTVLDETQRYIRIDGHEDGSKTIPVAKGVSFIATANIGNEYSGTNRFDRALLDKFSCVIELDVITREQELELLQMEYPTVKLSDLELLTKITSEIRTEYKSGDSDLSTMMSTRMVKEAADFLSDGFTIAESLELTLLPLFDDTNGADSERQTVKTILNKILPKTDEDVENLIKNFNFSPDNPWLEKLKQNL